MYVENTYEGINHIEHDIFFKGTHGGKTEKKQKRKPTPEEMERWNFKKRVSYYRHLIQGNFESEVDYWVTLKYPKGDRPDVVTVRGDYERFRKYLGYRYRKAGKQQKYIYRMEIGKRGAVHLHAVMNSMTGNMHKDIYEMSLAWKKARRRTDLEDMISEGSMELPQLIVIDGRVDVELLRTEGGYQLLAEYLCKPLPGDVEKELTKEEIRKLKAVGSSRNLVRPEPIRKTYTHWTMKKLIEAGPGKINSDPNLKKRYLTPGCIIDKDSWEISVNPVTGMTRLHFLEIRVSRNEKDKHIHLQRDKEHKSYGRSGGLSVRMDEGGRYSGHNASGM